jgi:uncharacterized membrane protein
MSALVAIAYPDLQRAEQVLDTLEPLCSAQLLDLEDACYVTRDAQGATKLHQTLPGAGQSAGLGALWGGLWGFLFGFLILIPIAGMAIGAGVGAGTGALVGGLGDYGIDDQFVKRLGAHLTPNSSAIILLVRRVAADKVVPELSRFGGTVIQTSLSPDAQARLQAALVSHAPPAQGSPAASATPLA